MGSLIQSGSGELCGHKLHGVTVAMSNTINAFLSTTVKHRGRGVIVWGTASL